MARLPGIADLGGLPGADPARPIAGYDTSGLARAAESFGRGGAAVAEAGQQAGQRFVEGTRTLGTGLAKAGEGLAELQLDMSRWDYAKAHSDFVTKKVELDHTLSQDKNYAADDSGKSMVDRYKNSLTELREGSAASIRFAPMRERFMIDTDPLVVKGVEAAQSHATSLEHNASIAYVAEKSDDLMNKAVKAGDEATRTALIDSHNGLIDGLVAKGAITPVQAVSMKKQWAHRFASADTMRLIDVDPSEAVKRIEGAEGIFGMIPVDQRFQLLAHAKAAVHKKETEGHVAFDQRLHDTGAEALDPAGPGVPKNPLTETEFKMRYGAEAGAIKYKDYKDSLDLAAKIPTIAALGPEDTAAFLRNLRPEPGQPGYAEALKRINLVQSVLKGIDAEKKDPATFAITRLPAVRDAFGRLNAVISDPAATEDARQAAARTYADITRAEQTRVGIPPLAQTIVPKDYIDHLKTTIMNAQAAGGGGKVAAMIENEAKLWGDNWPSVYHQTGDKMGPMFLVLGSGVQPHAAQLLVNDEKLKAVSILKEQDEAKYKDIAKDVRTELTPFMRSMFGADERDPTVRAFQDQAEKLAAIYTTPGFGMEHETAAKQAVKDIVGFKYQFRDGVRIPTHDPASKAAVDPDMIQAGLREAKRRLPEFNLRPAVNDLRVSSDALLEQTANFWRRDGVWATASGKDTSDRGVVLVNPATGGAALTTDGKPIMIPWARLEELGREDVARRRGTHFPTGLFGAGP